MKHLAILGSTGSIGRSALAVVDAHPERLRVVALAAGDNAGLLAEQVARYRPGCRRDGDRRRRRSAARVARLAAAARGERRRKA